MGHADGLLFTVSSVVFLAGAAIGMPAVFASLDPAHRSQLLENHRHRWQWSQPLYAAGPIGVAAGAAALAARARTADVRIAGYLTAIALSLGAAAWTYTCWQRASRIKEFAFGGLSRLPFTVFFSTSVLGIALLGVTVFIAGREAWLGLLLTAVAVAAATAYLRFGDVPPFVFYVVFLGTGFVAMRHRLT